MGKEQFISHGLEARTVGTLSQQNIKEIKNLTLEEVMAKINAGDIAEPVKYTLDVATLTTDKQFDIAGNFFGLIDASATSVKITVKFNKNQSEGIDFTKGLYMTRPFNKLFLSWEAQTGATVQIIVASFNKDLFEIQDFRSEAGSAVDLSVINANTRGFNSDTGTFIAKNGIVGNGIQILHTVTAGKTLYITLATCGVQDGYTGYLSIRNVADVEQYKIIYDNSVAGHVTVAPLLTPAKVPAGYDVYIETLYSGGSVTGTIIGWEE